MEKNIIYSINNKKSYQEVEYRSGGFFVKKRGILQNFAVLVEDKYLFIRIDDSAYPISKKVFKNLKYIDDKYIICLGTEIISNMMISKGVSVDSFEDDVHNLFHCYTRYLIKIFNKYNIDFKELFFNTLDYFGSLDYFSDMITGENSDIFWDNIKDRYWRTYNNWSMRHDVNLNKLEERELNEADWIYATMLKKRNRDIDNILN